ncbi:MAG: acyltransferase [Proteobacteria bacterium]|nr:acyltransferase [Pseudomonadota bacterium]
MQQFRNIQLDGLRGYAALAVALGHCNTITTGLDVWKKKAVDLPTMSLPEIIGSLAHVLFPADAAVLVFFVLSGYVLWGSMIRKKASSISAFIPYLLNRSYRLFPVSIAVTLMFAAFLIPTTTGLNTVLNAFFLQINMNGVAWSLQIELGESVILFFIYFISARYLKHASSMYILLFISLFLAIFRPHGFYFYTLPFLLGAALHNAPSHFFKTKLSVQTAYFVLAFVLFLAGKNHIARILCCFASFAFVGNVLHQKFEIFSSRFSQFLGNISYSFYLTHPFTVGLVTRLSIFDELKNSNLFTAYLFLSISTIAIALPLSYLVHIFIEKPGMAGGAQVVQKVNQWLLDRKTKRDAFIEAAEA